MNMKTRAKALYRNLASIVPSYDDRWLSKLLKKESTPEIELWGRVFLYEFLAYNFYNGFCLATGNQLRHDSNTLHLSCSVGLAIREDGFMPVKVKGYNESKAVYLLNQVLRGLGLKNYTNNKIVSSTFRKQGVERPALEYRQTVEFESEDKGVFIEGFPPFVFASIYEIALYSRTQYESKVSGEMLRGEYWAKCLYDGTLGSKTEDRIDPNSFPIVLITDHEEHHRKTYHSFLWPLSLDITQCDILSGTDEISHWVYTSLKPSAAWVYSQIDTNPSTIKSYINQTFNALIGEKTNYVLRR